MNVRGKSSWLFLTLSKIYFNIGANILYITFREHENVKTFKIELHLELEHTSELNSPQTMIRSSGLAGYSFG